jgi:MFS family permease
MDWRVRALTAALMTIVMVAIVTFVATWLALGFDRGFMWQWGKAFLVAWPIAAVTGFLVMPVARRLAERITGRWHAPAR